jgi:hypothetical protein
MNNLYIKFYEQMSINTVPDFLLIKILTFISDNKTSLNFISSCRYFKNLFYKEGFVKHIKIDPHLHSDPYEFSMKCGYHRRTLDTISITHLSNPQHWISVWPRVVFINNCFIKDVVNPSEETNTEILYILNNRNVNTQINWEKFPKLRVFETTSTVFNIEDIRDSIEIHIKN